MSKASHYPARNLRTWGRSVTVLLLSVASLLLIAGSSGADERGTALRRKDSYQFALALIDGLGWAHEAATLIDAHKLIPDDRSPASRWVSDMKVAGQRFLKAAATIQDFTRSENEFIVVPATGLHSAYTGLEKIGRELMDAVLGSRADGGAFKDQTDDMGLRRNGMLSLLPTAAGAARYALVKFPANPEEPSSRLNVTAAQRSDLMQRLEKMFGESIKQGPKGGQLYPDAAAAIFYQMLANPRWKSLDTR